MNNVGKLPGENSFNSTNDDDQTVPQSSKKRKRSSNNEICDVFTDALHQRREEAQKRHNDNMEKFDKLLDILERKM